MRIVLIIHWLAWIALFLSLGSTSKSVPYVAGALAVALITGAVLILNRLRRNK